MRKEKEPFKTPRGEGNVTSIRFLSGQIINSKFLTRKVNVLKATHDLRSQFETPTRDLRSQKSTLKSPQS